ncbi:MAG: GatB/YqeY domain-containing protein [Phyllobacteriaceae bacterium]|nr:GatB/YqeY domain-containing protein [Phyllobacteriaceae bacterium]
MRAQITEAMKDAMRAKDSERLSTIRLIQSALKDKDIANRGQGKPEAGADEIVPLLAKMVKAREDAAKLYDEGGRPELAAKERAEIVVVKGFMPDQMDEGDIKAAVAAAIAATGAASIKDMGKVVAELKAHHAGKMDFGKASAMVKAALG